jgi:molybdenum cofactor synthesis domain-containing protein
MGQPRPTIGIVIIGDEILNGSVNDRNTSYLIDRFRELNSQTCRVAIVPDLIDVVADTVRSFSKDFDFVVTTGGIGPTHDDITVAAVAKAFNVELVTDAGLREKIRSFAGDPFNAGHHQLAQVPAGANLLTIADARWPVLNMGNVYVLPGVPSLLKRKFEGIAERFRGASQWRGAMELKARETDIADTLRGLARNHAAVAIGSYPEPGEAGWTVRITVVGTDRDAVTSAYNEMQRTFGASCFASNPVSDQ